MDTVTNPEVDGLAALRSAVAESVLRAYGAEREYAVALNGVFAFAWFDIEASDKSETAKPVHAEKTKLFKVLKAAKHSNPSTVWARVRKYGNDEAALVGTHGKPLPAYDEEGNAITDLDSSESNGANNKRSPMLRNIEELSKLYMFNAKQESLDQKIFRAQTFIASALAELGVDLANLK